MNKKDFESNLEVRWCPGCGDYAILASVQKALAEMNANPENTVFISGIGCSSRFPYYMNTYGFHTIHGRAPTFATGLKMARPELDIWLITGDGDGLSIGTNHLVHMMRRNIDVTILLFNNRIYGLTKGQVSPTSELGKKTKSTPYGSIDRPLDPISIALAAGCGFVARAIDIDSQGLQTILKKAAQHSGTSFVEIYQNCNVFNDGAFTNFADKAVRAEKTINLEPGAPLIYGNQEDKGLLWDNDHWKIVKPNKDKTNVTRHLQVSQIMEIEKLGFEYPLPIGIFRADNHQTYQEFQPSHHSQKVMSQSECQVILEKGIGWIIDDK